MRRNSLELETQSGQFHTLAVYHLTIMFCQRVNFLVKLFSNIVSLSEQFHLPWGDDFYVFMYFFFNQKLCFYI